MSTKEGGCAIRRVAKCRGDCGGGHVLASLAGSFRGRPRRRGCGAAVVEFADSSLRAMYARMLATVILRERLIVSDQDAFVLLAYLRANNRPDRAFLIANGMADKLGWPRKRLAAARTRLGGSYVERIRTASSFTGAAWCSYLPMEIQGWSKMTTYPQPTPSSSLLLPIVAPALPERQLRVHKNARLFSLGQSAVLEVHMAVTR